MATSDQPTAKHTTVFSRPNGDSITVTHTEPLEKCLGADLLASIKFWHNGSTVRRGDSGTSD